MLKYACARDHSSHGQPASRGGHGARTPDAFARVALRVAPSGHARGAGASRRGARGSGHRRGAGSGRRQLARGWPRSAARAWAARGLDLQRRDDDAPLGGMGRDLHRDSLSLADRAHRGAPAARIATRARRDRRADTHADRRNRRDLHALVAARACASCSGRDHGRHRPQPFRAGGADGGFELHAGGDRLPTAMRTSQLARASRSAAHLAELASAPRDRPHLVLAGA